ncbi:MAG: GAF domain-containing sensor histidine kinase [Chloroflexota bacterium]
MVRSNRKFSFRWQQSVLPLIGVCLFVVIAALVVAIDVKTLLSHWVERYSEQELEQYFFILFMLPVFIGFLAWHSLWLRYLKQLAIAKSQYRQQRTLAEVLTVSNNPTSLQNLLEKVAQLTALSLNTTGGANITLWQPEGESFLTAKTTVYGETETAVSDQIRRKNGATRWIIDNSKPYVVHDIANDRFANGRELKQNWMQAYVGVPLLDGKRPLGVLYAFNRQPRQFKQHEIDFMVALADKAAMAIVRTQLDSELKAANQTLQQYSRELETQNEVLQQAIERLRKQDRLKTKFFSDMAHELRTPVTALNLHLELIQRTPAEKHDNYLNRMHKQVERLKKLVENDFVQKQWETEQNNLNFTAVCLNQLVTTSAPTYGPLAQEKELALNLDLADTLSPILGDEKQLRQMLHLLLNNSLAYTETGHITVRTAQVDENTVCLAVEDSGVGIADVDRDHIFERFYRGQEIGQSHTPGNGIGLFIVWEIVRLHRAVIEVNSKVNEGSHFRVHLPTSH